MSKSTMQTVSLTVFALAAMGAPMSASAEPQASITLDLGYLAVPVLKGALEYSVAPQISVRASGGYGRVNSELYTNGPIYYELGAQGRYYVLGNFRHGLALGGEARYAHAEDAVDSNIAADGVAVGPIAAYKYISRIGLTVDLSGGMGWMAIRGKSDVAGETTRTTVPFLNINLGWSF